MNKTVLALLILSFSFNANSKDGTEACHNKKTFLKGICKAQELIDGTAHFSSCSNGYSYYISMNLKEKNTNLMGTEVRCKMVEMRNESSINKRTTYFDEHSDKVVVYEHTNGLSNTFVYGNTGYYHISELSSGDSLYHFYSF